MSEEPYISIVATSRNDDHGGDMRKRMNVFVHGLIHQCNKYKLPCELVMVDWNSPDPNNLLHHILPKPKEEDYLSIKYVIVPSEIHDKMRYSQHLGLYQMIAKNVGIKRATANFILCTNVDLLFSDELFEILAQRNLKEGHFYRANRCDVPNTLDENVSVDKQLEFCKANILKKLGKHHKFAIYRDPNGYLMRSPVFYPILYLLEPIKKMFVRKDGILENSLDFDACGDFTMMSKADWEKIKGYVELEMYSIHIDSMGLFSAAAQGIKQQIFPSAACTFHMAHTGGWEFAGPLEKIRFFEQKPSLEWWSVWVAGKEIIKNKSNFGINDENWGLADKDLQIIDI